MQLYKSTSKLNIVIHHINIIENKNYMTISIGTAATILGHGTTLWFSLDKTKSLRSKRLEKKIHGKIKHIFIEVEYA